MIVRFENSLHQRIVEQREREIRELAIETASRLRGKKPTSLITVYKEKITNHTVRKKVNYGFLNLFVKEVEESIQNREFVTEIYDVGGWILDDSRIVEYFEYTNGAGEPYVHLEETFLYFVLSKEGALEKLAVQNFRAGRIYGSSFPHKADCSEIKWETTLSHYQLTYNDPGIDLISDVSQLDFPCYTWRWKTSDGGLIIRNFPLYLKVEQTGQNISEKDVVDNYGTFLLQRLRSV